MKVPPGIPDFPGIVMDATRKLKKHVQTRPLRGVYIPSPAAVFVGGHSVKIIGWGTDETSKLPYWIVANS